MEPDADLTSKVRSHYGGDDLEERLLTALRAAGVDVDALTVADLAGADQLHAGGLDATRQLFDRLDLSGTTRLLDVGCGIGGPARAAAAAHGCPVVGIDLSAAFIDLATALTARVGLGALVEHRVGSGDRVDLPDDSVDRAMIVHVGMNIPDKRAVFAEVRRVLRPGGRFGVYEQMLTGDGPIPYPLPWATDATSSFLQSPAGYAEDLAAVGFEVELTENVAASPTAPSSAGVSPGAVFGPGFAERIANNVMAARAGTLSPVMIIAVAR